MKMLDLRKQNNRYYFKLGRGPDFQATVRLLKNAFNPKDRTYDDETHEWSVPADTVSEAKLSMIFNNAETCFTYLKAQLPLFPQPRQPG
jgi:hypothetical protein